MKNPAPPAEAAVLESYESALSQEIAEVGERHEELKGHAKGLRNTSEYLSEVAKGAPVHTLTLSTISPLISHVLLRKAFADLPNQPSRISEGMRIFVGRSLLELLGSPQQEVSASGSLDPQALVGICDYMEFGFSTAYEQVMGNEFDEINVHRALSVYHDESGVPLILQKTLDEPVGMLLEPCSLDGITIPAGTAVGVGFGMRPGGGENMSGQYVHPERGKLFTYAAPDELQLMPRRITPWAHAGKMDRAHFAVNNYYIEGPQIHSARRIDYTSRYSLEDFKTAAGNIMSLCGTETTPTERTLAV